MSLPVMEHEDSTPTITVTYLPSFGISGDLLRRMASDLRAERERISKIEATKRSKVAIDIRRVRARARRTGYQAGKRQAQAEALEALVRMHAAYHDIVSHAHQDCLSVALACARDVLADQIVSDIESLRERIRRGIKNLLDARGLRVALHSSQLLAVKERLKDSNAVECIADDSVQPGNARIETLTGRIEINWLEHLNRIEEHLSKSLRQKIATRDTSDEHSTIIDR